MMCCMPSLIPDNPTPQACKLFRILKLLSVFQLCFGIFTLFVDISSGFYIMIGAVLLYLIPCGRNWCTSCIYIIICIMDAVPVLFMVGFYFQSHRRIDSQYGILLAVSMLKFPFYLVSIYYAFLTYRELKAITLEMALGLDSIPWQQSPPSASNTFSGPGYRL